MGSVIWARKDEIKNAHSTIPAVKTGSLKDFRPPPTIKSDFKRLLDHDVEHVNFSFELIYDWYATQEEGYSPIFIRAQQTPIDWKSKIGNSDMSANFKVTHDVPIHKGDMVVREDGMIYLLNWNIQNHPNNQATQSIECNSYIEITREMPEETDKNGYLIHDAKREIIVPSIPCIHSLYAGRPDYASAQGQPGINADHLLTVQLQWNDKTKNIRVNDEFVIGAFTYRVVDISIAQVDITRTHGVIDLNARRVAGGGIVEE